MSTHQISPVVPKRLKCKLLCHPLLPSKASVQLYRNAKEKYLSRRGVYKEIQFAVASSLVRLSQSRGGGEQANMVLVLSPTSSSWTCYEEC